MANPNFSTLLQQAVNEPGTIMKAYSAFHNYSIGNQLLALVQCQLRGIEPGPITTFPKWQDLKRHVKRGEKALTLCMPVTVKRKETNDTGEDQDASFTTFVYKARWFVLAQTDGEAMDLPLMPAWDADRCLSALEIERIAFTATDQYNAVRDLTIPVEIAHTNRPPIFIGEDETMSFNATGLLNSFSIEDFFSDPDGDEFTFSLTNNNSTSVGVFASESEFLIRPISVGEAKLAFIVTDSHGAITKDTITAKVDVVLGAEEGMVNNGLGVYPNPAVDQATITVTNDWTGNVDIAVLDVNGKQYLTHHLDTMNAREITVDVSKLTKGIYMLRAISKTKQATIKLIKK